MAGEAAQAGPVKRLDDALAGRDAALLVLLAWRVGQETAPRPGGREHRGPARAHCVGRTDGPLCSRLSAALLVEIEVGLPT